MYWGKSSGFPLTSTWKTYHVVRPGSWDRTQDIRTALFRIEEKSLHSLGRSSDLFHRMAIPELKVASDEELLVKKVKRRPGVLVVREGVNPRRLADSILIASGKRPNPNCHVFAPVFSLRKDLNVGRDYPEGFIERVKAGDLPEFIHLPPDGRILRNESMAVLTQLQVHGERFVEETEHALEQAYFEAALETFWQDLEGQVLQ